MIAVQELEGKSVRAYCDSGLIGGQVQGDFEAKDLRMLWYLNQVKSLSGGFHSFTLEQVPQSKNSHVDSLSTLATLSREKLARTILVEDHTTPAYDIQVPVGVHFTRMGPSWMDLMVTFLKNGTLPEDRVEAEKIRIKVLRFWLSED